MRTRQRSIVPLVERSIIPLVAAILLALTPLPAAAGNASYAGTVSAVGDESLVIRDTGPWMGPSNPNVVNRTIVLTPSTAFAVAERAWDGAKSFPGDYAERPATRADLTEGDFVAVECQQMGAGCRAQKLTIVRTDQ
jgi:hypothetical protein